MSETPSSNGENPEYGMQEWGNDRQDLGYLEAKIEEINANILYQKEHRMFYENDPSLDKKFSYSMITNIDSNIQTLNKQLNAYVNKKIEIEKRTNKLKL